MKKYEHAFGKNDIRGIYGEDITEELYYNTGRGFVEWLKQQTQKSEKDIWITIARDARLHSPALEKALAQGITSTGANVILLGLAPTPIGYYSEVVGVPGYDITASAIITASHNPSEYNGLKMTFNKHSLNEEQIKKVKEYTISSRESSTGYRQVVNGIVKEYDIIANYQTKISSMFGLIGQYNGKKIKVVVDSANATGGIVAPQLYRDLGCEVVELYSEPDGTFPNHHPNPSDLKTLDDIRKKVIETKADVGIAFDGDSDRIGAISNDGAIITGDKLLLIYAQDLTKSLSIHGEKPVIVSEVKCSQVLYDEIERLGATGIMTKTGHGYIKSKMKETGALLAGEMSGHTFFKDRYFGYDDAIYAGCRLIEIIAKNKVENPDFKLTDLLEPFNKVFLSDEVRLKCPNELKKDVLNEIKETISDELFNSKIKDTITIDGIRLIFEDGFALIRQSNTEPVFTLRFEAKTKEKCEHYKDVLVNLTNQLVEKYSATKV